MPGEERAGPEPTPGPVSPSGREPVLDVLRGFAILGILLVNVEYMRGADFYLALAGEPLPDPTGADRWASFAVGWLATGKFISSLAIMFGIGAALIAARAQRAGRSPRGLLARRYALLLPLGLAHMVLLFPGDVLLVYGLAGFLLLAFVGVRASTALWWSGGILAFVVVSAVGMAWLTALLADAPADDRMGEVGAGFFEARREAVISAFTEGGYGDVVVANAWEALFIQSGQIVTLPWIVALFLLGFAAGRAGVVADLASHRGPLRRAAAVGLGLGLPLNLAVGALGPMAMGAGLTPGAASPGLVALGMFAVTLGAPLLAVGYLSTLALLCLRVGALGPLAQVGRMALTAYLAQSLLALVVFAGLGLYERVTLTESLLVVAGIWALLLALCPLWMRWFRFGPVEWLWRAATYGSLPRLRADR